MGSMTPFDRPADVDIRLLGPFEVLRGGRPVAVSSERLKALLAVLAMSAGQVVSQDAIGAAVWGQETPDSVRRSLHTYVARLRRLLGDRVILTAPGGYRLDVAPDRVDALRFLRLAGSTATDPETLLEALALWRGRPFEGVVAEWWTDAESPRLLERYLTALEQRVDLDLETDDSSDLAAELRELTTRYPLRESLWVRLLTVLDRTGRRAEALECYETIRSLLASRLGVDPGPELQRQHAALLAAGDGSAPARATTRQLPTDTDRFTGRAEALTALDQLLQAVSNGGVARPIVIAAVHGTGGIGKTALAVHWAHRVRDRFPDGQLFVNLRGYGPGKPVTPSAALDVMLRSLGVTGAQIPTDLDARSALLRSLLADRRMLVLLDNARDANQVRPLLPGSSSLVVVTSRNQLRGLVVRDGAQRITLDELRPAESVALLKRVLPERPAAYDKSALAELAELCGHLPLALRIAAEHAARQPGVGLADLLGDLRKQQRRLDVLDSDDPSASVRAVFSWSYQTLDPESAWMFRLLGAHPGLGITLPAAAALFGGTPAEARRLLDRLIDAHLVERRHHRYEQHDLIRTYAAELADAVDTQADRDAALRRVFGFYVHSGRNARAALGRAEPLAPLEPPPDDIAPLEFADDRQALAWFDTMRETTVAAVQLAADRGLDRAAYQLSQMMSLAFLYWRAFQDLFRVEELGVACARHARDVLGEASSALTLGTASLGLGDFHRAVAHHERAFELFEKGGSVRGQADALEMLGRDHSQLGRSAEAVSHLERSVELARKCGDHQTEPRKLNNLADIYIDLRQYDNAVAAARRALDLCQGTNRVLEGYASDTLGNALTGLHQHDDAVNAYQRSLGMCRELGDRWQESVVLTHLARAQQAAGKPGDARRSCELALQILDDLGSDGTSEGVNRADIHALLASLD